MKQTLRIALFTAIAIFAPLAFAKDAKPATAQAGQAAEVQAQTDAAAPTAGGAAPMAATQDPAAMTAPPQAAATASTEKKSWSDVDTDKNGSLSQSEAAGVPALGEVFVAADANADGQLSADEYKAYVASTKAAGGAAGG